MYANLFGDFVKGVDYSSYPEYVQRGIRLHRTIDDYIDHHPEVVHLLHSLYEHLPRISGIAIDLYFDHLLAIHWDRFHTVPLEVFTERFHSYPIRREDFDKVEFWYVIDKMREGNWLLNYRTMDGLRFACRGLSRRISFKNNLDEAPEVFERFRENIEKCFEIYMQDARIFFEIYLSNDEG